MRKAHSLSEEIGDTQLVSVLDQLQIPSMATIPNLETLKRLVTRHVESGLPRLHLYAVIEKHRLKTSKAEPMNPNVRIVERRSVRPAVRMAVRHPIAMASMPLR